MAHGARRVSFPTFAASGALLWTESRPQEQGRNTLMRRLPDGQVQELLPAPWDVGTRAHEYGGRAYVAWGDAVVFVSRRDHSVNVLESDGSVRCLVASPPFRLAEPVLDATRRRLIAVAEWPPAPTEGSEAPHSGGSEPRATLVSLGLDDGRVEVLREGADFYAAPTLRADGAALAWVEWNHPHMPWDASAVFAAALDPAGRPQQARHVAGDATASAQQPAWGEDGTLFVIWERDGAWGLWSEPSPGSPCVRVTAADGSELGGGMWNLGVRTWGLVDAKTALALRIDKGRTTVVRIALPSGELTPLHERWPSAAHLAVVPGRAAVCDGWDGRGSALGLLDATGELLDERQTGLFEALAPESWSQPLPLEFPTTGDRGEVAYAWFYPPKLAGTEAPESGAPPLVVMAHGGPTAAALASGNLNVQFWTSRGFAVLDVNYRGSTGFGRAYRERLRGMWGVYDVDDCVAAACHVAALGWVDPDRMVIRGGSAGGFTVLAALAFHDVFRAGASHYGVSDIAALVHDTHKFESRYDRFLFGEHEDPAPLWRARSPLYAADRITAPVIFFQGMDDKVVPPSQTERMVETLRAQGVDVEYQAYEGEGHGFRRAENVIDSWQRELAFYVRVLRLA